MATLWQRIAQCLRREDGPTATEYAVMLGIISISVLVAMSWFGERMHDIYVVINTNLGG